MLPIVLHGGSLNERHKELNALVNEAVKKGETHIYKDAHEFTDVDRLFKIKVAIKCRDVDYIIETLKSDDTLYASHALKAIWLISDDQFASIINPENLYENIFPQMYNDVIRKMKLNIRLHLRSEERCQLFYKYHWNELGDPNGALAFLPYCSKSFIETCIDDIFIPDYYYNHSEKKKINLNTLKNTFKLTCERFIDLSERMIEMVSENIAEELVSVLNFIAISEMDHYLYLLEKYCRNHRNIPMLSKSLSKEIARKNPEKLINQLDVYIRRINFYTVGKTWSKEQVLSWIDIVSKSEIEDVKDWYSRRNVEMILEGMSYDEKKSILDKYFQIEEVRGKNRDQYIYIGRFGSASSICSESLYKWYKGFSFETSFEEIRQLIKASRSAEDRSILLLGLLRLTEDDLKHVHRVVEYFYKYHMNEQTLYKIRFLTELVTTKRVYRFSEESWKPTNDLFISMDAYGDENYPIYNEAIVFYNILHDKEVPEMILEKYYKNNLYLGESERLTEEESARIYDYLIKQLEARNQALRARGELSTDNNMSLVAQYANIVKNWKKCIINYPTVIQTITDIVESLSSENYNTCNWNTYVVCHHIVKGTEIPTKIMENHISNGYSNNVNEMTNEDKLKVFNYFVIDFENRSAKMRREDAPIADVRGLINSFIRLLRQNNRSLVEFPYLISLIRDIILIEPNSIGYPRKKCERKKLFHVSILMSQDEDVLIDALKHNSILITKHIACLTDLMQKCKRNYHRFLKKVVVYFPNDLAIEFQRALKTQLQQCENDSSKVKYVLENLCVVYKKEAFIDAIKVYFPDNHKVEWEKENLYVVGIRKHLAGSLHQVRPFLDIDTLYQFAKGDYVQSTLPSLLSICIALPTNQFGEKILPKLLNSPVSIQKHGIRLALKKLPLTQVCQLLSGIWFKSKNVSIRNAMFESTFQLLIQQVKEDKSNALWELIEAFVTNLQEDEERTVLQKFYKHLQELPYSVRCKGVEVCYTQMERIRDKIDWYETRKSLFSYISDWIADGMDLKFVAKIILEMFKENIYTDHFHNGMYPSNEFRRLLVEYLTFSEENQEDRYDKVARPIFSSIIKNWHKTYKCGSMQIYFGYILESLMSAISQKFYYGRNCVPTFTMLFQQFETVCPLHEHFNFYMIMKLLIFFIEASQETDFVKDSSDDRECYKSCSVHFSNSCGELVNNLVNSHFPSIRVALFTSVHNFVKNILGTSSKYYSELFLSAFVDNLVKPDVGANRYLLGLYFYNRLDSGISKRFEEQQDDYYETVKTRLKKIDNKEIQFHLSARVL